MRKNISAYLLIFITVFLFITGCTGNVVPSPTTQATTTAMPTVTPTQIDPQALLESAVDHFVETSNFRMSTHEVVSYESITADGTTRSIYGEFKTEYDYLRKPEVKVRVGSQFRYIPDSEFIDEEYYLFEQEGVAFILTFGEDGAAVVKETGGEQVDLLVGDAYQGILQYGKAAEFTEQDGDEFVYKLDHPEWYVLRGAIGFADLGLLHAQPDGDVLVREYAAEMYPDVQPVRFILHVSIADKVITKVELDNRAFMQSFWESYDQALIDQGTDPTQLTQYDIQPEHGMTVLFSDYGQVPDFDLPK
jgi:hypothetical protein